MTSALGWRSIVFHHIESLDQGQLLFLRAEEPFGEPVVSDGQAMAGSIKVAVANLAVGLTVVLPAASGADFSQLAGAK
jgi:hypothetical protein